MDDEDAAVDVGILYLERHQRRKQHLLLMSKLRELSNVGTAQTSIHRCEWSRQTAMANTTHFSGRPPDGTYPRSIIPIVASKTVDSTLPVWFAPA